MFTHVSCPGVARGTRGARLVQLIVSIHCLFSNVIVILGVFGVVRAGLYSNSYSILFPAYIFFLFHRHFGKLHIEFNLLHNCVNRAISSERLNFNKNGGLGVLGYVVTDLCTEAAC